LELGLKLLVLLLWPRKLSRMGDVRVIFGVRRRG
jgi:hypothetical protein